MIVPKRIDKICGVPFSPETRGVRVAPLRGNHYYAFNYDQPSGVKLLRGSIARRLLRLVAEGSGVPQITACRTREDLALAKHRLLFVKEDPSLYNPGFNSNQKSFHIWLHVINGCNFRCFYCYIPHLQSHIDPALINKYSMSEETARAVIDGLLAFCRQNRIPRLHIKFAGGEPSLNLPLIESFCKTMTAAAGDTQVSYGMISNGTFSTEKIAPILTAYGLRISISIDGFETTHDRTRFLISGNRRVGSWAKVRGNIHWLLANGIRPYLLFTLTRNNASSAETFASWAHSHGLGFRISPIRLRRAPTEQELDLLLRCTSSLYTRLGKEMPTSLDFERDARFAEWNLQKRKLAACGSCRNYVAVSEIGEIRSCQMSDQQGYNFRTHTLDQALQGFRQVPTTALLAQPHLKTGACTECEYYRVCVGGCPQHTISVHGTSDVPSPWCRLYGTLMPIYIKAKAEHMLRQISALCR